MRHFLWKYFFYFVLIFQGESEDYFLLANFFWQGGISKRWSPLFFYFGYWEVVYSGPHCFFTRMRVTSKAPGLFINSLLEPLENRPKYVGWIFMCRREFVHGNNSWTPDVFNTLEINLIWPLLDAILSQQPLSQPTSFLAQMYWYMLKNPFSKDFMTG